MAKRPPRKPRKTTTRVARRRAAAKSPRKKAAKKATKKVARRRKKAGAPKSGSPAGKGAKKVARKPASQTPPRAAPRALSAGVKGRPAGGRSHHGKRASPNQRPRKLNLRPPPHIGRRLGGAARLVDAGPWPALDEAPSETGLRERILLCVLSRGEAGDAETLAACRRQIWDWLHPPRVLKDGRTLSRLLFEAILADEMAMVRETIGPDSFDAGGFETYRSELLNIARLDRAPGA